MDFREQRPLLRNQLVLSCEILRRHCLLPAGVDLAELGFQVVYPNSADNSWQLKSRYNAPFPPAEEGATRWCRILFFTH
jgi:hypothetical protein